MEGSAVDDDWELEQTYEKITKSDLMKPFLTLFTDEVFVELKEGSLKLRDDEISKVKELFDGLYEEQLNSISDTVWRFFSHIMSLTKMKHRLQKQLAEEQSARLKAEAMAQDANDEIRKLTEQLERAQRETEELKAAQSVGCAIL